MRISDFIEANAASIADGAQAFAATQAPRSMQLDEVALRDHIPQILEAIVRDLRSARNAEQRQARLDELGSAGDPPKSAAQLHGRLRAKGGFNINQMVAEYRALRASVLRLWTEDHRLTVEGVEDIIRFNEAVDAAVAESVADFSNEAEAWRQVFLGVLGHDLRGPLAVIVSTSELLVRMTGDTPYTEPTQRIIRSGRRMSKLLDDLLDYSRTSLGLGVHVQRTDGDLEAALEEEIAMLRIAFPQASIAFETTGESQGQFDASRVREALHNLVTNAIKYGDAGSEVRVSLEGDTDEVRVFVRNRADTLPAGYLEAMFEPLQRGGEVASTGERESLGLGLFIVREIAKAHGGDVSATSSDNTTAFAMRFPKQPAASNDQASSS
jgi:signal transduction histidine kinase